jgi:hypothetical protein
VRSTSEEAAKVWDRSIDLIFIDGDHSYERVKSDWILHTLILIYCIISRIVHARQK